MNINKRKQTKKIKMARRTKKTQEEEAEVAAPPPAESVEEVEQEEETPTKTRTKRVVTEESLEEEMSSIFEMLDPNNELTKKQRASLSSRLRRVKKDQENLRARMVKEASSKTKRKKRELGPNSGFNRPVQLSDNLCTFLKLDKGSSMKRGDISKVLWPRLKDKCTSESVVENDKNGKSRKVTYWTATKNVAKILKIKEGEKFNFGQVSKRIQAHLTAIPAAE